MVDEQQIMDQRIPSGLGIPLISHGFAHNAYWTDKDVYLPIAKTIETLLK